MDEYTRKILRQATAYEALCTVTNSLPPPRLTAPQLAIFLFSLLMGVLAPLCGAAQGIPL